MTRELKIDLEVLIWLRPAGDLLTPEPQLRRDVRNGMSPAPSPTEISESLNRVETKQWAVTSRLTPEDDVKWSATALGLSQLSKRGL